jgi:uncharacterized membrane protein
MWSLIPFWLKLILMHLFWAVVILAAVWVVHALFRTGRSGRSESPPPSLDSRATLLSRYARGEITSEQYEQAMKAAEKLTRSGSDSTPPSS